MKIYIRYVLVAILIFVSTSLISFEFTYAYFADQAQSTSNTFSAAAQFPVTPPLTSFQKVVINEIMWMGNSTHSSTADEWIELRNMTNSAINISGWTIENLGAAFPNHIITLPVSSSIPANGFYLIANFSETNPSSILNISPNYVANINLNNNGEQLILKDTSTNIIDVANGTGAWLKGDNTTIKKSMSRAAIPGDGTLIGSWFTANSHANLDSGASESATPKAAN